MLSVILIWSYILATTAITGYGAIKLLTGLPFMQTIRGDKSHPYMVHFRESYVVCGIVLVTVYSEIWSLFGGVGLWANIVLIIICILALIAELRKKPDIIIKIKSRLGLSGFLSVRNPRLKTFLLYTVIFLLMAYGTSHGLEHYDTGLYHAQAIHWIENFGSVTGLGNLHVRLAYNSAAFPLSALFSLSELSGQSYHVCAGFFGLLLAWKCADIVHIRRRKRPVISDFARLAGLYYIFSTYDEIVSPASDFFVIFLILYIIICWLDLDVRGEKNVFPYALLAIATAYACTIKLSAAPFLLLSIKPVVMLLRNRKGKTKNERRHGKISVLAYILLGFCTVIPFFIRNYILSGWLVYPFTAIDIFNVQWKIPKGVAQYDAALIKAYGRGYTDASAFGIPFAEWFPHWLSQIGTLNRLLLFCDVICAVLFILYIIWVLWKRHSNVQRHEKVVSLEKRRVISDKDFIFITGVLFAAIVFWLCSSPLIRYGSIFLMLPCLIISGRLIIALFHRGRRAVKLTIYKAMLAGICIFILYKGVRVGINDIRHFQPQYLINQQDYVTFATSEYEIEGITFYYPESGDQAGYEPFPSSPVKGSFKLGGTSLKDGFLPE